MRARRSSAHRLAILLLVSAVPGCSDDPPERGAPVEQESEGTDEGEAVDVCIEECKPVEQDCEPGEACLPDEPGFSCRRAGTLRLHEACEAGYQTCAAGLVCLQAAVPGCTGGTACCVALCDMELPECTDGTQCVPVFEAAAMCYEDVGVCVLF